MEDFFLESTMLFWNPQLNGGFSSDFSFQEAEQKRLDKIQAVAMKSNVQSALDSFANLQKSKVEENISKVDAAAENRYSWFKCIPLFKWDCANVVAPPCECAVVWLYTFVAVIYII